jgi:hypothetical protein
MSEFTISSNSASMTTETQILELKAQLNLETAQIEWSSLERFFAAGRLLQVASHLDLIEVGAALALDNLQLIRPLHEQQLLGQVSDTNAFRWSQNQVELWALVIKPFVLVQERAMAD